MERDTVALKLGELESFFMKKLQEEWCNPGRISPEWYDHMIDIFLWFKDRNPLWVERGMFASQIMQFGDIVLDLACGDGIYPSLFYSKKAKKIIAVDKNPAAIEHAKFWYGCDNVVYVVGDILQGENNIDKFNVIVLNGILEHLDKEQMQTLFKNCRDWGTNDGVVCGSTIEGVDIVEKRHPSHKYKFHSLQELGMFLKEFWVHVYIYQTQHTPDRINYYFRCSNSTSRNIGGFGICH